MYTNEKWSDPFDENGNITLTGSSLSTQENLFGKDISVYPNPVENNLNLNINSGNYNVVIYNAIGKEVVKKSITTESTLALSFLQKGIYFLQIKDVDTKKVFRKKFIKQ